MLLELVGTLAYVQIAHRCLVMISIDGLRPVSIPYSGALYQRKGLENNRIIPPFDPINPTVMRSDCKHPQMHMSDGHRVNTHWPRVQRFKSSWRDAEGRASV